MIKPVNSSIVCSNCFGTKLNLGTYSICDRCSGSGMEPKFKPIDLPTREAYDDKETTKRATTR